MGQGYPTVRRLLDVKQVNRKGKQIACPNQTFFAESKTDNQAVMRRNNLRISTIPRLSTRLRNPHLVHRLIIYRFLICGITRSDQQARSLRVHSHLFRWIEQFWVRSASLVFHAYMHDLFSWVFSWEKMWRNTANGQNRQTGRSPASKEEKTG